MYNLTYLEQLVLDGHTVPRGLQTWYAYLVRTAEARLQSMVPRLDALDDQVKVFYDSVHSFIQMRLRILGVLARIARVSVDEVLGGIGGEAECEAEWCESGLREKVRLGLENHEKRVAWLKGDFIRLVDLWRCDADGWYRGG